jgi:beta-lactamase class A
MRELGTLGVRVDRSEAQQSFDYHGVQDIPPQEEWTLGLFLRLFDEVAKIRRSASAKVFLDDPRDTSTPDDMAALLVRVQRGDALEPASTALLLDVMTRSKTGPRRLKGRLPPGTLVAHKTGTWGAWDGVRAAVNDVGIITLPNGGHIAIAVFVKGTNRGERAAERVIAHIARAVYDSWAPASMSDP